MRLFRPLSFAVLGVGMAGGAISALYVGVLRWMTSLLGPDGRGDLTVIAVLVATGLAIALLVHLLGDTGDVELLVDNVHIGAAADRRALRSLIPVSLLGIAAGGALTGFAVNLFLEGSSFGPVFELAPAEVGQIGRAHV